jgi:hypothetical protein
MQVKEVKLFGDRVLIKPLKEYTYTVKELRPRARVPMGVDNIDLNEVPDSPEMVEVDVDVKSNIQRAVVVSVGDAEHIPCNVGDTVLYHIKTGIPFELIKGCTLLKHYDIIGVVNK